MSELVNDSKTSSSDRDKAIRLVDYLTRIAQLRSKIIRNVDDYESKLWISDIPSEKECYTRAWGRDENHDSDIWIEIQRPVEPELPTIPDVCKDWVHPTSLRDKSNIPELPEEINEQIENPNWSEDSDETELIPHTKFLQDCPEVQKAWDAYIEGKWLHWVADYNAWESIHNVYSELFAIRQEQNRLSEEFELVLALGLLIWRSPSGQFIRRHLLATDAMLEFEKESGTFTLKPGAEGAKLRPELDMLDAEDCPPNVERGTIEALDEQDDPWEREIVEGVLKALVHSLDTQGVYDDSLEAAETTICDRPVVVFAPALILRKRSAKGLTDTLKRIREQIERGKDIPDEFRDLAEIPSTNNQHTDGEPTQTDSEFDGEVFFPKPSNKEQRRIVNEIRAANGVLVQGPPGTGKSHTIANLICHLLATGKRILVTAKTPRALEVLEGLVPNELQALCVNLIGSGTEGKRSLESSVNGILHKHRDKDEERSVREREKLEQKLHKLREEKSKVDRRLRDIRESETYSNSISEGTYQGTAAKIAEAINKDKTVYQWFTDEVPTDRTCPISENDMRRIIQALRHFTPEKRSELNQELPDALPSPTRWNNLIENEAEATREENNAVSGADEPVADGLSKRSSNFIESLQDALEAFLYKRRRLMALNRPWIEEVLRVSITGQSASWCDLLRATRNSIAKIEPLVEVADNIDIDNPEEINLSLFHDIANELQCFLREKGGKLKFWRILPKSVVEHRRLIKKVKVNGRCPSVVDDFQDLEIALRVRLECEKAWGFWVGHTEESEGPYQMQVGELKGLSEVLEDALSLEELTKRCRELISQCATINEPLWSNESQVETIVASCRLAIARQRKRECELEIKRIEEPVAVRAANSNSHPLTRKLRDVIRERNEDEFLEVSNGIQDLLDERKHLRRLDDDVSATRQHLPRLMDALEQTCQQSCWDERVNRIQDAWRWAYAKHWVEDFISQEDAPALAQRANQIEDEINNIVAQLSALNAWLICFSRLTDNHRRHMEGWKQAMQDYGKGTGKHAARNLRTARDQLDQCSEAVPAWVMPLHSVWDTVNPAPGKFDVVVVDEASQCGIEAMPLFYLGKKILIVGDDKQISPEAVGLPLDAVHRLIDEFLHDYEFKPAFNVQRSIFDHGRLRYGKQHITLREHFRCMPEIIRFSNDLCYSGTPLIPLRQYGPDRLPPLQRVFVDGGYREGSGGRVINRPEADAIVDKIVKLCNDCTGRYKRKSMGVVVLQGQEQARLIETQLLERLGAKEIEQRRLVCGNPYSFQGDERDIMFLSLVAATNERIGPLTKPADERRFNVAASRAKDQMYLFHSVTRNDLSETCFRRRLLEFFENTQPATIAGVDRDELERLAREKNRHIVKPPSPFESWFELDVALEISGRGFNVIPQYQVANRRIDLVVEGGNARLAVECDGDAWHGPDEYESDMFRQRQLERCGWGFFRVRQSAFVHDKERALERLWHALEERQIFPTSR